MSATKLDLATQTTATADVGLNGHAFVNATGMTGPTDENIVFTALGTGLMGFVSEYGIFFEADGSYGIGFDAENGEFDATANGMFLSSLGEWRALSNATGAPAPSSLDMDASGNIRIQPGYVSSPGQLLLLGSPNNGPDTPAGQITIQTQSGDVLADAGDIVMTSAGAMYVNTSAAYTLIATGDTLLSSAGTETLNAPTLIFSADNLTATIANEYIVTANSVVSYNSNSVSYTADSSFAAQVTAGPASILANSVDISANNDIDTEGNVGGHGSNVTTSGYVPGNVLWTGGSSVNDDGGAAGLRGGSNVTTGARGGYIEANGAMSDGTEGGVYMATGVDTSSYDLSVNSGHVFATSSNFTATVGGSVILTTLPNLANLTLDSNALLHSNSSTTVEGESVTIRNVSGDTSIAVGTDFVTVGSVGDVTVTSGGSVTLVGDAAGFAQIEAGTIQLNPTSGGALMTMNSFGAVYIRSSSGQAMTFEPDTHLQVNGSIITNSSITTSSQNVFGAGFAFQGTCAGGSGMTWGVFGAPPVGRQTVGALTNSVTSGGTTDVIANFTDLTTYSNSAAAIRNNFYQLARKVAQLETALSTLGWTT